MNRKEKDATGASEWGRPHELFLIIGQLNINVFDVIYFSLKSTASKRFLKRNITI